MKTRANNIKNLIPADKLSENMRKEYGRRGGLKSGETKRAKKRVQETLQMLLELSATDKQKSAMEKAGVSAEFQSNMTAMLFSLYLEALKGNVNATRLIIEQVEKNNDANDAILKLEELIESINHAAQR